MDEDNGDGKIEWILWDRCPLGYLKRNRALLQASQLCCVSGIETKGVSMSEWNPWTC
jgi:hypothetical protein